MAERRRGRRSGLGRTSSCSTKLFWRPCGQSISRCVSIPLSHRVTPSLLCNATWTSLLRLSSSSSSSSLPYVIHSHLSLSHLSSFPRSASLVLPPPPLTHTISPPYHPVPTLKLSSSTSFRSHAVLSPLQNSGFRREKFEPSTRWTLCAGLCPKASAPSYQIPII